MPNCQKISIPRRGFCAGDLDRRIKINGRDLESPSAGVDHGEKFTTIKTVWAGLKSTKGRASWYSTNMDKAVTHAFFVRWIDWLNTKHWIEYRSENYDIIEIDNLDERNEFAVLYCNVRGANSELVNHA